MGDKPRGYTEGVQDCINATLLAAAYQEQAGDIVAATLLRRMTEAFRHKIDSEVTSVDVLKDGQ